MQFYSCWFSADFFTLEIFSCLNNINSLVWNGTHTYKFRPPFSNTDNVIIIIIIIIILFIYLFISSYFKDLPHLQMYSS